MSLQPSGIGGGALILDQLMQRFGFSEVLVSEHDILDGIAWSLTREPEGRGGVWTEERGTSDEGTIGRPAGER